MVFHRVSCWSHFYSLFIPTHYVTARSKKYHNFHPWTVGSRIQNPFQDIILKLHISLYRVIILNSLLQVWAMSIHHDGVHCMSHRSSWGPPFNRSFGPNSGLPPQCHDDDDIVDPAYCKAHRKLLCSVLKVPIGILVALSYFIHIYIYIHVYTA